MDSFTPWTSLAGGALLGLSAVLLMLFNGRIAGISGIIGGLLAPKKGEFIWRLAFIIGMVTSLLIVTPFGFALPEISNQNLIMVCSAGLLVGFGTRLGNGCTSGHGIIGMGRFSKRSIAATMIFMSAAIVTVLVRSLLGDI